MDVIRTLVVDDESPARSRLLELLQREPHIKVVGVASYAQLQPAGTYTSRAVATKVLS